MIICSKCGTRVTEDTVYCPNCGKRIGRADKERGEKKDISGLTIALAVIICILAAGCAVLGVMLLSRLKKDSPQAVQSNISQSVEKAAAEKQEKTDSHQIYAQYFREILIPKMGVANTERLEGTISWSDTVQSSWHERKGIIGADFADLDADEQDEMIVCYFVNERVQESDPSVVLLNADVYKLSDCNEVIGCGTVKLADFYGESGALDKVGILQLNGKEYLYHHEYEIGIIATGWRGYYTLYTMENRAVRKAYVLGNPELGSSEELFLVEIYSDNEKCERVCYANASSPDFYDYYRSAGIEFADNCIEYNGLNRYECDSICWKQLGVDIDVPKDSISEEPDYWNSSIARGGSSLVIMPKGSYNANDSIDVYSEMEIRSELLP